MFKIITAISVAPLLLLSACTTTAAEVNAPVEFMLGCWTAEDGSAKEVWAAERSHIMFGYGVAYKSEELVFFEQLHISRQGNEITYVAAPMGQGSTAFKMTEKSANHVRFENPEHDYPQVIEYRRTGENLDALISLSDGSNANSFSKSRCGN